MNVTIIGTGNMERGLAHTLARGGHAVTLQDRQLDKAEVLAREVRAAFPNATIQAGTLGEPIQGDAVILATWYAASQDLARQFRDEFAGKVVVKAFNTTFAGTLVQGQVAGQPLDVFVAGDDAEARRRVLDLVNSGGLRGIDAGGLERARQLEGLGLLGITLQGPLGTGFMSAWKLLS